MEKEIAALEANIIREIIGLPAGKRAINSKWVYTIKFKQDGNIGRYKARFVVRGFYQMKDKDCPHTFSLVAKLPSIRIFIDLAAQN